MINGAVVLSGVWVIRDFNGTSCFEKVKKIKKTLTKLRESYNEFINIIKL